MNSRDSKFFNRPAIRGRSQDEYTKAATWVDSSLDDKARDYYNQVRLDMCTILITYNPIRLRDLKSFYVQVLGPLDLRKLNMDSMAELLISLNPLMKFKVEEFNGKEETYIFPTDITYRLAPNTSHMQRMVNATQDKNSPKFQNLSEYSAKDAFIFGFLDVAEGVAPYDPRVPNQCAGIASQKEVEAANSSQSSARASGKKSGKFEKKSYEEQTAKKPEKTMVTAETTAPINPSEENDNSWFLKLQKSVMEKEKQKGSDVENVRNKLSYTHQQYLGRPNNF